MARNFVQLPGSCAAAGTSLKGCKPASGLRRRHLCSYFAAQTERGGTFRPISTRAKRSSKVRQLSPCSSSAVHSVLVTVKRESWGTFLARTALSLLSKSPYIDQLLGWVGSHLVRDTVPNSGSVHVEERQHPHPQDLSNAR